MNNKNVLKMLGMLVLGSLASTISIIRSLRNESNNPVNIYTFDRNIYSSHPVFLDNNERSIITHTASFLEFYLTDGIDLSLDPLSNHGTSVASVIPTFFNEHKISMPNLNIKFLQIDCAYSLLEALKWSIQNCLEERHKDPKTRCIISISEGYKDPLFEDEQRIHNGIAKTLINASRNGISVVLAAGNHNSTCAEFPQNIGNIYKHTRETAPFFIVGGLNKKNTVIEEFNTGECVNIYAPAEEILVAAENDKFIRNSGTSFAAPYITSVIAALYRKCPSRIAAHTLLEKITKPVDDVRHPKKKQLIFSSDLKCDHVYKPTNKESSRNTKPPTLVIN